MRSKVQLFVDKVDVLLPTSASDPFLLILEAIFPAFMTADMSKPSLVVFTKKVVSASDSLHRSVVFSHKASKLVVEINRDSSPVDGMYKYHIEMPYGNQRNLYAGRMSLLLEKLG